MVVGWPVMVTVSTYSVEVTSISVVIVTKIMSPSLAAEAGLIFAMTKERTVMIVRNCILIFVYVRSSILTRSSDMYGDSFIDKSRRSTVEGMQAQAMSNEREHAED